MARTTAQIVTFAACVAVWSASCGDDGGGTIEDTDAVTGTSGTSTPDDYPVGPYGADVGEILPNLLWTGFPNDDTGRLANAAPYTSYSLDEARRSGKPYALLHFGAVF